MAAYGRPKLTVMNNLLIVFIVITGCAVVLQALILFGMYLAMKQSQRRMESLANRVEGSVLPAVEQARDILTDTAPRIKQLASDVQEIGATVKNQVQRMDVVVTDLVDRTRLQAIRVDEMVTSTLDKVEQAATVINTVSSIVGAPARRATGIMQGISVAVSSILQHRRRAQAQRRQGQQEEELFI
jgi:methyl-accepting chemotaxis protein